MSTLHFRLNGQQVDAAYEKGMYLLDVLRDECGMLSVKNGCAPEGSCGCCLVQIDGTPALSVQTALSGKKPLLLRPPLGASFSGLPLP